MKKTLKITMAIVVLFPLALVAKLATAAIEQIHDLYEAVTEIASEKEVQSE